MKKIMAYMLSTVLSIGILFSAIDIDALAASETETETVYITQTGECYHTSGCASLKKSKIETSLQDATSSGYRACSKCKPPTLDATPAANSSSPSGNKALITKSEEVWLSATGSCYHSKNNCGKMNPNKARKVTKEEAEKDGMKACSKCW